MHYVCFVGPANIPVIKPRSPSALKHNARTWTVLEGQKGGVSGRLYLHPAERFAAGDARMAP